MPNISQQDYIIIDWEGKSESDAAKKAEVDAQLRTIYHTNPLTLLSVLFKRYGGAEVHYTTIINIEDDDPTDPGEVYLFMWIAGEMTAYSFSIE